MFNYPKENLVRALSEAPEIVDSDSTIMRGHFAVWNTWTEIRSTFEGHFLERFAPGSMTKTIAEGRDRMRVLFQHGRDNGVGEKPLGTIDRLEPDDHGAYYEVSLFDTSYNADLIPGLRAGQYGASHRFQIVSEDFNKKPKRSDHNPTGLPERTVTEAKVIEFGPVTWGAYPTATAAVRSLTDEYILGRFVDDPERLALLIEQERKLRRNPRVTVTYGRAIGDTETPANEERDSSTPEPEPPAATTPTPAEPEPSEATTRSDRGLFWFAEPPKTKRSR